MKARKSFYNIFFGIINQLITIALGIVIPRLFILSFGSETNGLISSINQVFVYFGILEAGVGGASLQALYSPIAKGDTNRINGILSATSKYYKKTGIYYFFAVLIFSIVYPFFVTSNLSKVNIMMVILLIGMCGVINFLFQGKFKVLLEAEGKGYITTNVGTIISLLNSLAKIVLILLGFNVVIIQLSYFFINAIQIIIIWGYINKNYKWINLKVSPNFQAISQKSSVLVHQISNMIFNNTDVLILTIFCGLKVVSVYVMYNTLFVMINTLISNINKGAVFILGQSYYEDKNKYLRLYEIYELYYINIVFAFYSIGFNLILPFMKLYTRGINDINYIDLRIPILFVVLNLLLCARTPCLNAIDVSGHFKQTKYRSILESIINLIGSIIGVSFFGIYGVLLGTIVALLYRTNDIIIYSNKHILNRSPIITYKRCFVNIVLFLFVTLGVSFFNFDYSSYLKLVYRGILLSVLIFPLFIAVSSLFDIKVFIRMLAYLKPYKDRLFDKV